MSQGRQKLAAVVLAAGKGTRMKSDKAKVLHEACGRPMAFFPIRAALALDASPVVVVVGHQAKSVEEELSRQFPGAPLRFAVQAEQLGTGHAVLCAEEALRGLEGTRADPRRGRAAHPRRDAAAPGRRPRVRGSSPS